MSSRARAILVAAAVLALPLVVAAPAAAADEPSPKLSNIRICDPTGCYVAWRVVDSDGDGVCDADELMAGTDPFDRNSYPPLEVAIELAAAHKLPSFENGLAAFVVFPAELLELREKYTNFPSVGGFSLPARESTLTRLGIDLNRFEELKLSVQRDAFAIGLGSVAEGGDGVRSTHISAFGQRITEYEAGVPATQSPAAYGGYKGSENLKIWDDADYRLYYNDGSHDDVTLTPGGTSAEHINPDGSKGNTTNTHRTDYVEDGVRHIKDSTSVFSPDGRLLSTTTSETIEREGGTDSYSQTTEYVYDADGNLVGTVTTETVVHQDGDHVTAGETTTACDTSGTCTSVTVTYYSDDDSPHDGSGSDHGYVNPDYADDTVVTLELADGLTRVLGSNITVVQDWTPPYTEGTIPEHRLSGVMYVDDIAGVYHMTISEPRITTAQPELHPGLPNPMEGAPPPKIGGCDGLC